MFRHNDRPLKGWSDRYVKAHMSLLKKDEVEHWITVIDEFGSLLKDYIRTSDFVKATISQKKYLLDEFCLLWNLPYCTELVRLLHEYQHLPDFNIFVDTWKEFYYKTIGFFHVQVTTTSLLTTADINKILQVFSLVPEKCRVTQKVAGHLMGGFIIECNGKQLDTSILKQLKTIQRNLSK